MVSYLIRFPDEEARSRFLEQLSALTDLGVSWETGEFLPDVILGGLDESQLPRVKQLAGQDAKFMRDFTHQAWPGPGESSH